MELNKELLNADLKEYFKLKQKKEELEAKLKELNAKIVKIMEDAGEKKFEGDDYSATLAHKENIKYKNEKALIEILKSDEVLNSYVIETINTTELNKLIKNNETVAKKLQESYSKSPSTSLTVTKN